MDDLRNHDARPDAQERAWMTIEPMAVVVKLVALAGIALAIGVSVTQIAAPIQPAAATVASAPQ
jgi:Sec-independent protein secretion pathway component TatC